MTLLVTFFIDPLMEITARFAKPDIITIRFGPEAEPGLRLFLPDSDEEATAVLERLEAVIDNAYSAVQERQRLRVQAEFDGAGASVEAYRG